MIVYHDIVIECKISMGQKTNKQCTTVCQKTSQKLKKIYIYLNLNHPQLHRDNCATIVKHEMEVECKSGLKTTTTTCRFFQQQKSSNDRRVVAENKGEKCK